MIQELNLADFSSSSSKLYNNEKERIQYQYTNIDNNNVNQEVMYVLSKGLPISLQYINRLSRAINYMLVTVGSTPMDFGSNMVNDYIPNMGLSIESNDVLKNSFTVIHNVRYFADSYLKEHYGYITTNDKFSRNKSHNSKNITSDNIEVLDKVFINTNSLSNSTQLNNILSDINYNNYVIGKTGVFNDLDFLSPSLDYSLNTKFMEIRKTYLRHTGHLIIGTTSDSTKTLINDNVDIIGNFTNKSNDTKMFYTAKMTIGKNDNLDGHTSAYKVYNDAKLLPELGINAILVNYGYMKTNFIDIGDSYGELSHIGIEGQRFNESYFNNSNINALIVNTSLTSNMLSTLRGTINLYGSSDINYLKIYNNTLSSSFATVSVGATTSMSITGAAININNTIAKFSSGTTVYFGEEASRTTILNNRIDSSIGNITTINSTTSNITNANVSQLKISGTKDYYITSASDSLKIANSTNYISVNILPSEVIMASSMNTLNIPFVNLKVVDSFNIVNAGKNISLSVNDVNLNSRNINGVSNINGSSFNGTGSSLIITSNHSNTIINDSAVTLGTIGKISINNTNIVSTTGSYIQEQTALGWNFKNSEDLLFNITSSNVVISKDAEFKQNVVIKGNLTVSGTSTYLDMENISLADSFVTVNKNPSNLTSNDYQTGIEFFFNTEAPRIRVYNDSSRYRLQYSYGSNTNLLHKFTQVEGTKTYHYADIAFGISQDINGRITDYIEFSGNNILKFKDNTTISYDDLSHKVIYGSTSIYNSGKITAIDIHSNEMEVSKIYKDTHSINVSSSGVTVLSSSGDASVKVNGNVNVSNKISSRNINGAIGTFNAGDNVITVVLNTVLTNPVVNITLDTFERIAKIGDIVVADGKTSIEVILNSVAPYTIHAHVFAIEV